MKKEHEVKYQFGGKRHFFKVKSQKSGEIYDVDIQFGGTCYFMAIEGIPNGEKLCGHICAVLKEILIYKGNMKMMLEDHKSKEL